MTTHSTHPAGDFCWMDLNTSDPDAATAFYSAVFGWEIGPWPAAEGEEVGGYRQIRCDGAVIGGLMRSIDQAAPPAWNVFFAADDLDKTAAQVVEAGGRLLVEPMPVPGGRVALFTDPPGAFCGILQTEGPPGVERTMDPGTVCWLEVGTRDRQATRSFYESVFSWRFSQPATEGAPDGYSFIHNGEHNLGGLMEIGDHFPPEIDAYWMLYIGVSNLDETLAELKRRGGEVGFGPTEMPDGRLAVVSDPQGAHFAVIEPSPEAMARAGR